MSPMQEKSIVQWVSEQPGRSVTIAHHQEYQGAFSECVVITAYSQSGGDIVTCNCAFNPKTVVDAPSDESCSILAAAAWDAILRSFQKTEDEGCE